MHVQLILWHVLCHALSELASSSVQVPSADGAAAKKAKNTATAAAPEDAPAATDDGKVWAPAGRAGSACSVDHCMLQLLALAAKRSA